MTWVEMCQENWWQMLLASLVFAIFGVGTIWCGVSIGGARFLLLFKGVKTTGQLTRVERDHYTKKYQCYLTYDLLDGRKREERILPITLTRGAMKKKIGTEYTVFYDEEKPKNHFCPRFWTTNLFGLICLATGIALVVGAVALCITTLTAIS